jgi:hypothetical protein
MVSMVHIRLVVAWTLLLGGITLDVLAWLGLIAQNEPALVLHLSIWALIFEGFNGVQVASDRKKDEQD